MRNLDALIQAIHQFIRTSPEEAEWMSQLFSERSYAKSDYFLREGEVCRHVGFIQQGVFRYFINRDGEELTYFFSAEHEFICEYESFLAAKPSTKNIQCLENANILTISYDHLQELYARLREGEKFGRLVAEQLFVTTIQQITSLYRDSPDVRYAHFMAHFPHIHQRIPQYYVASYVGVKPQSLSRIRSRFV